MNRRIVLTLLISIVVSLPFIGSECDESTTGEGPGSLAGSWRLVYNSGTLHDICPGETVRYPNNSGGIAELQCPNQNSIMRDYTVSNSILTYTQTGAEYTIVSITTSTLQLEGMGSASGRYLNYSRTSADNIIYNTEDSGLKNSSE